MARNNRWAVGYADPRIEEVKLMLCEKIEAAIMFDQKTDLIAANWLGTSRAVISKIRHRRVEELSLNQLFFFLARLRPNFQILISPNRYS